MRKNKTNDTVKMLLTVLVFIGCVIAASASGGWITWLLFGIGAFISGEYLGDKLFGQTWFQNLSVEHAGFSMLRIIVAVLVVLLVAGMVVLGRVLVLQVFR